MDKFGVMLFLLKDYNELGAIHPKSAKEISIEVNLPLSETYLTLKALQKDKLIWRLGRKNQYRYGIKEESLAHLNKLYNCLIKGKEFPSELLFDYKKLDEIADNFLRNSEIKKQEELLQKEIKELLGQLEFIEVNEQFEMIESVIDEIVEKYSPMDFDEKFELYLKGKLNSIWEYIVGARIVVG